MHPKACGDLLFCKGGACVLALLCIFAFLTVLKEFGADPLQILDLEARWGVRRRDPAKVKSAMRYVSSRLHQATCAGLKSGRLSNEVQLRLINDLYGPFMNDTKYSGRSSRSGGGGGGGGGSRRAPLPGENFCWELRTKRGFDRWPVTLQEEQFPLSFGFKVHKSQEMFVRLLSTLWRPHNLYCVHVDLKASPAFFQFVANVSECFDNVILAPRLRVLHGDISSLKADIECAEAALRSPVKWRYHIGVCGMEFPLKTNLEMVQILKALNGTNDIENYPADRNRRFYAKKASIMPFQHEDVVFKKGSAYNAVTRQFLHWALHGDQIHRDFLEWLNGTFAPDELFWATLSNREGAPGGPRVHIRHDRDEVLTKAVNWAWDPYKCRGVYVQAVCVFRAFDLPWLLRRHELIANKFDPDMDSLILDCLEQELERRALFGYMEVLSAAFRASGSGHQSLSESVAAEDWTKGRSQEEQPLLSSLNWTLYRSLPQFARSGITTSAKK